MDYKIGSLADLISGNKTPNKAKVIKKSFTPLKKEVSEGEVEDTKPGTPDEGKRLKRPKIKPRKNKLKNSYDQVSTSEPIKSVKLKGEKRKRDSSNNVDSDSEQSPGKKQKNAIKIKREKRKIDTSNGDLADSDGDQSPSKKQKKSAKFKAEKRKINISNGDLADSIAEQSPSTKQTKSAKFKVEKRKINISNSDLADSDAELSSPEKKKLSRNEQNAAGRIKNKKNKEVKNSSEYNDRTVFVGNIPINLKKEKIKKYFRKYGEIETVRVRGIPVADLKTTKKVAAIKQEFHPDRNTIYAYIRFKKSEDAKKAEAANGELFEDHHLRVHCCESDEKPDESKAIFVGNLPFNAEDEELWKLFKPCGPISHVRIIRDGRSGMGKGFGYINFKDSDSVQLALEMEKVVLKDRELRISLCDSSRAKKKKAPKKPRMRTRIPKTENEENRDGIVSKKKKTFKVAKMNPGQFGGTKFDEKKKKKKFSKVTIEKKKLAKKLVAPKPNIQ